MRDVLQTVRRRLGPPERPADQADWSLAQPPGWLHDDDLLMHQVTLRTALARHGEVVWGAVVMANTLLWSAGEEDAPATFVYSFDPWFEARPELLHDIGQQLYRFHGDDPKVPRSPWMRQIADQERTGFDRELAQLLPPALTRFRRVYSTSLLVERAHLPLGHIVIPWMPIVALREGPIRPARVVPHGVWPRLWLERWNRAAASAGNGAD